MNLPYTRVAPAVKLAFHVEIGKNYQAEYSADLSHWFSFGAPFTASSNEMTQYVDADANARYWRLAVLP